jgi:cytochrome c
MRLSVFCFAIALIALFFTPAQADDAEAIAAGRELAQKFCSNCHAIGMSGKSSHPDAPPFREIVARGNPENLQEALGEGIAVGHPAMPQFWFKPQNVSTLVAYLKSLSGKS